MNSMVTNRLIAPGRMDVVEQVLTTDPFFRSKIRKDSARRQFTNRRGIAKRYSDLTIKLVTQFAEVGLDAAKMRRDEILAKAFQFCELGEEMAVA
jgi:hypothetical protein